MIKIIKILLVFIVIGIIAVIIAFDNIMKYVAEGRGSELLDTSVTVQDIDSSFFDKEMIINEIAIANTAEFAGDALTLAQFTITLDRAEPDLFVIDNIVIDGLNLNLILENRKFNFLELQRNLQSNYKTDRNRSKRNVDKQYKFVIENLSFINTKISVTSDVLNTSIDVPDFTLTKIGAGDNANITQVLSQIKNDLVQKIKTILNAQGFDVIKKNFNIDGTKEIFDQQKQEIKEKFEKNKKKLEKIFKL